MRKIKHKFSIKSLNQSHFRHKSIIIFRVKKSLEENPNTAPLHQNKDDAVLLPSGVSFIKVIEMSEKSKNYVIRSKLCGTRSIGIIR